MYRIKVLNFSDEGSFFLFIDAESKLLDEISGGMATHRMRTRDPFAGGLPRLPADPLRTSQGFGATPTKTGGEYICLYQLYILPCLP